MAGTVVVTKRSVVKDEGTFGRFYYKIEWTADAADGSVPNTALIEPDGGGSNINAFVVLAVTDPGTPAPTASYDVTLEDAAGVDIMGGALTDRSATLSEQAMPLISGSPVPRLVKGPLTFKLANNSVNSAQGVCYVYFQQ